MELPHCKLPTNLRYSSPQRGSRVEIGRAVQADSPICSRYFGQSVHRERARVGLANSHTEIPLRIRAVIPTETLVGWKLGDVFCIETRYSCVCQRVALYLRVSTTEQTVENQQRELEAVAERHGWNVVAIFTDSGFSGTKGRDKRPGYDRLCRGVARREFDQVAAWSVRSAKLPGKFWTRHARHCSTSARCGWRPTRRQFGVR